MNLLIVTGLSGAGKSLAMHALEDIGFFCIDNIPANLSGEADEFAQQSENTLERVAVVLDIRGGKSSEDILNALGQLKAGRVNYKILFLTRATMCWSGGTRKRAVAIPSASRLRYPRMKPFCRNGRFWRRCMKWRIIKSTPRCFPRPSLADRVVSLFVNWSSDAMAPHGDVLRLQIRPAQRGGYRI